MTSDELKDNLAVDLLAVQLKRTLAEARAAGKSGWDSYSCSNEYLSQNLQLNVDEGNPIDVAAYCAFILARGETIKPKSLEESKLDRLDKSFKQWEKDLNAFIKSVNELNMRLARMENVDTMAIRTLTD